MLVYLIIRWALAVVALYVTSRLVPGIEIGSLPWAMLTVALLALLNALVHPIVFLLKLGGCMINLLTLGLYGLALSLLANTLVFYLVGQGRLVEGFHVKGFLPALEGALLMMVFNGVITLLIRRRER